MRSVAKGNYIKGRGGIKHALSHIRYLQTRSGDDREQYADKKRLFISADRDAITGREVAERIKTMDENKVVCHRVVLSPGVEGVDMNAYTRAVMSALSHSKGLDFEYYAIEHKNTEHGHTHVILLGKDLHGRQVTLNRNNYKTIREAGDRYLERHHKYERFLDKELHTLLKNGFKHDRGDQDFESLLEDMKSPLSFEEWEAQRRALPPKFDKDFVIESLPESETIIRDNVTYSKYSNLDDLLELDKRLNSGELERISKEQYQDLWSWIGKKKQFGEDYFERTAEEVRIFQQFEEDFRRSVDANNGPPKSFHQYVFEGRGRLLDSHERYAIDMQRLQLQKELDALEHSDSSDQKLRLGIQDQLDWLDAMMNDRMASRKNLPIIQEHNKQQNTSESTLRASMSEVLDPSEKVLDARSHFEKGGDESQASIEKILFGDVPAISIPELKKSETGRQIELWHELAFNSEFNRYVSEQANGLAPNNQIPIDRDQAFSRILQEQVQQTFQEHVKVSFWEFEQQNHQRTETDQGRENNENERVDPGREHSR